MDKEAVFWELSLSEFPQLKIELDALLPKFIECIDNGLIRPFNKQCAEFFERNNPTWARYDKWLAYYEKITPSQNNEEDDWQSDYYEMGELLAHRLFHAYYARLRREQFLDSIDNRPYWQLVTIKDGCECPECKDDPVAPSHWQSAYWQNKKLPCEWLFCRSRIMALTEDDVVKMFGHGMLRVLKNCSANG